MTTSPSMSNQKQNRYNNITNYDYDDDVGSA